MGSGYDRPPSNTVGVDLASKYESWWVDINAGEYQRGWVSTWVGINAGGYQCGVNILTWPVNMAVVNVWVDAAGQHWGWCGWLMWEGQCTWSNVHGANMGQHGHWHGHCPVGGRVSQGDSHCSPFDVAPPGSSSTIASPFPSFSKSSAAVHNLLGSAHIPRSGKEHMCGFDGGGALGWHVRLCGIVGSDGVNVGERQLLGGDDDNVGGRQLYAATASMLVDWSWHGWALMWWHLATSVVGFTHISRWGGACDMAGSLEYY